MSEPQDSEPIASEDAVSEAQAAPGVDEIVPPVVLVLVTRDPGTWFEETLASISAQSYDNVSVFVVDAASAVDPTGRVAAVLPDAHITRLVGNPGFGTACNEALKSVSGSAFYLFCHDDVVLEPDAVQVLVEEAFRSNAGIVGPKIVDWSEPDRLLSVGMGSDKHGFPVAGVERGELDQSQHDAVRDVFYIPGAVTLIRADLFEVLGGFDPGISFHGDDLDIGWRAHVVGARVIVAPQARVRHLEALGDRRPVDDRRKLQMRHRLRAAKVSYSLSTRLKVMPQSFILAVVEVVYSLVLGRFRQARDVIDAWTWNWVHGAEIRSRRRDLAKHRVSRDRQVRSLQSRGSRRLSAFIRGQIGSGGDRLLTSATGRRDVAATLRSSKALTAFSVWFVLVVVLVVGSRSLIFGHLPAIRGFPMLGSSPTELLREWASGYRSVGLGSETPNPTGLGFLGFSGLVTFGNLELLRKLLIIGMIPLGAFGMWRLVKPIGTRRSRIVGLIVYMATPVAYNAMSQGRWTGLLVFGLSPWILSQLVKASKLAPFGPIGGDAGPGIRGRPLIQRMVVLGLLGALVMMLSPAAVVIVPFMAVALVVGGVLAGQFAGALRMLAAAVGGVVIALVLHLPWSTEFLSGDWNLVTGTSSTGANPLRLAQIVRFEDGRWGATPVGYAFLVTAGVALLIGRRWRLSWAVRTWVLAVAAFGCVWVAAQGWLPVELPVAEVMFATAAVGLAVASSMSMAAFEVDLGDYHFGWRQLLAVCGGAALVVGVFPAIGAAMDGRWGLPRGDYNRPLAFIDKEMEAAPFRVLWLGEANSLPVPGWQLDGSQTVDARGYSTFVFSTTDNGTPTISDSWPGAMSDATTQLDDVLGLVAEGGTSRLGSMLAPMGVRYIVVPLGTAPAPYAREPRRPEQLLSLLEGQLDLATVDVNVGVVVYRNVAWGPTRAVLAPDADVPSGGTALSDRTLPAVEGAPVALPDTDHFADFSGTVEDASKVYLANAGSERWRMEVDGVDVPRSDAMGWSNVFAVERPGVAHMYFDTPRNRAMLLGGQILLWIAAVFFVLRVRVVTDEKRSLDVECDA